MTAVVGIVMIMAALFVVRVFLATALHPAQDDKEDSCCENEGENNECFHNLLCC